MAVNRLNDANAALLEVSESLGLHSVKVFAWSIALLFALAAFAPLAMAKPLPATPMIFEHNSGQTDASVDYLARGPGYTLFLTPKEAVFSLRTDDGDKAVLRMGLEGAETPKRVAGESPLASVSHYFNITNGAQSASDAKHYARVRMAAVYPGIDLVYYGLDGALEYDFEVAAGADAAAIGLNFTGADHIAITHEGALDFVLGERHVQFHPPVAYQMRHGKRIAVESRYALQGNRVSFRLGEYDRHTTLVIDPVFEYATYLGGYGEDRAYAITVNNAGEAYVTGTTAGPGFPLLNAFQPNPGGGDDAYITKFAADGRSVIFSSYIGGPEHQEAEAVALDPSGNIYITGRTGSVEFNVFELKLNPAASAVIYVHTITASDYDYPGGIVADPAGNAYVVGTTSSPDFPTVNALTPTFAGTAKGFVRKIGPTGTVLVSTFIGATVPDTAAWGVARDSADNIYVTGSANDLDPDGDAYVLKLNSSVTAVSYVRRVGGSQYEAGYGIAVDGTGAVYVCGESQSSDFPIIGGYQTATGGGTKDGIVFKLDPAGTLVNSTYYGGAQYDLFLAIALAADGSVIVGGRGGTDPFNGQSIVVRFNATLANRTGLARYGSSLGSRVEGVAVDSAGAAYVAVHQQGTGMPITPGAYQNINPGDQNGHVAKILFTNAILSAVDQSTSEGNSGSHTVRVTATLDAVAADDLSVAYATANGTAQAGSDYVAESGTLIFPVGSLSAYVDFTINGDTLDEADETFFVNWSAPDGIALPDPQVRVTILDDDAAPTVAIADRSCTEGNTSSTHPCAFTVSLSTPSGRVISGSYATASGGGTPATPGTDYTAVTGAAWSIPAGASNTTVNVNVLGDNADEPDETFLVNLSSLVNAAASGNDLQALGTIVDDDNPPTVSIADRNCVEGNSGSTACVFTISLSAPSAYPVSGSYATAVGAPSGSVAATSGVDYTAVADSAWSIAAGATSKTVNVAILGDSLDEFDETFYVNLSALVNAAATGNDVQALGRITDDDPTPSLTVDNGGCSVIEGDTGNRPCSFVVRLSAISGRMVTFTTATADGTATGSSDYTGHTSTARSIGVGQSILAITVPVLGDTIEEPDETFTLSINGVQNATPSGFTATGTILDDDLDELIFMDGFE